MTFWGCVVKTGKESAYVPSAEEDMLLHISQACLDPGASKGSKSVLMLKSGDDGPYAICSLREGGNESVSLDLLVEDYSEFSVIGTAAIHLTGYLMPQDDDGPGFEDNEDDEDDDDDDFDMAFDDDPSLLGFDEDGLPIYLEDGSDSEDLSGDEEDDDEEDLTEGRDDVIIRDITEDQGEESEEESEESEGESEGESEEESEGEEEEEEEPPKKKQEVTKRKAADEEKAKASTKKSKNEEPVERKTKAKKYPNGFEIHELHQGKASGKLAKAGKRVAVRYTGRLTNGKVFDQTKGKKTFQFRLGVGEVIKGWDRGIDGMRVGDKRKLVIPPQMGYGSSKAGPIPANSTLIFDVELIDVKN